ncbi:hypothetical protein [Endozoicomonas acroporae]|uniref:hypothetical protein n=1 Tax=Endozoicomonas acroporae TaxID=1701104 RepID=UPI0013D03EFD|nr:hypothetical protein [Endozoicomonas acroporae]
MEQLALDFVLVPLQKQDNRLINIFINIGGRSCERLVPVWVYLKGWSFTRGWLKVGDAL